MKKILFLCVTAIIVNASEKKVNLIDKYGPKKCYESVVSTSVWKSDNKKYKEHGKAIEYATKDKLKREVYANETFPEKGEGYAYTIMKNGYMYMWNSTFKGGKKFKNDIHNSLILMCPKALKTKYKNLKLLKENGKTMLYNESESGTEKHWFSINPFRLIKMQRYSEIDGTYEQEYKNYVVDEEISEEKFALPKDVEFKEY